MTITIEKLKEIFKQKGYTFFENGDYNLNIIGVRSKERIADKFDDTMVLAYKVNGEWVINQFQITTDPGLWELQRPSFWEAQKDGTAILVPGQYRAAYKIGFHGYGTAWSHKALLQVRPIKAYRDKTKDAILDMNPESITEGLYGINIHASSLYVKQPLVCNWSAGCQVFADPTEYRAWLALIEAAARLWGDTFTYTLIEEKDFSEVAKIDVQTIPEAPKSKKK